MLIIESITFILVTSGIYMIIVNCLHIPSTKATKAMIRLTEISKETKNFNTLIFEIAGKIVKYIKIDEFKKKRMTIGLRALNMTISPEMYRTITIVKVCLSLLGSIISMFLAPILAVVFLVMGIIIYFAGDSKLETALIQKKTDIEYELPRFCSNLKQELKASRDVLTMLENYAKNAGKAMKRELDITIADMKSSNYTAALVRFEARISSASLSDIVRGLVGVLNGDNNITYFEMLSHDLDALELQRLENMASKQPGKINKYLVLLFASFIIMYVVILAVYTLSMTDTGVLKF